VSSGGLIQLKKSTIFGTFEPLVWKHISAQES